MQTKHEKPSGSGSGTTGEKFDTLALASDRKSFLVKLDNGAVYELPVNKLSVADAWDGSGIAAWDIVDHGYAAMVRLESGAEIDFPADFVLHICEPTFAYYAGRAAPTQIGDRVRALREERAWSQADLSRRSGIAVPNLSRIEHNRHVPSWPTIQSLARAFKVPPLKLVVK